MRRHATGWLAATRQYNNYPAPDRGTGYCFRAISFFLSFFLSFVVSEITRKRLDRFHEIFREGVE